MQDIIANTMKAIQAQRWYCADSSQPTTVELWLRIFQVYMQRNTKTAAEWAEMQIAFVKYITREAFTSKHLSVFSPIIPSLRKLQTLAPGHFPALATALCKLAAIDFTAAPAAPESENIPRVVAGRTAPCTGAVLVQQRVVPGLLGNQVREVF